MLAKRYIRGLQELTRRRPYVFLTLTGNVYATDDPFGRCTDPVGRSPFERARLEREKAYQRRMEAVHARL